ncbi:hypothetical protein RN001_002890 [Aquatica leii]|uniref:Lipase domain-containing protein n=1 Tax=Aquatica leii TaxID=1421715 RepID=A0AAN7SM15_9COLE|nr:hypothetical protein RN001_002890 [Aquatica leii]
MVWVGSVPFNINKITTRGECGNGATVLNGAATSMQYIHKVHRMSKQHVLLCASFVFCISFIQSVPGFNQSTVYSILIIALISTKFLPDTSRWRHIRNGVGDVVNCIKITHPPTLEDVKFYLFTRNNKKLAEEINDFNVTTVKYFNASLNTKILIHGYGQAYNNEVLLKMKDEYLYHQIVNVIMVDWHNLSMSFCYPIVSDYTEFVGQLTGYLLAKLPAKKVHIVGFSLGAHVAGIGAQMQKTKVLRVTGLDPAGNPFFTPPVRYNVNKTCAENVDVIHTSIIGSTKHLGHADFFVNGGFLQPACATTNVSCSHRRSLELYVESIVSNIGFKAVLCDSLNSFENNKCANNTFTFMGEPWLSRGAKRGIFYIRTNAKEPFAISDN